MSPLPAARSRQGFQDWNTGDISMNNWLVGILAFGALAEYSGDKYHGEDSVPNGRCLRNFLRRMCRYTTWAGFSSRVAATAAVRSSSLIGQ